MHDLTPDQLRDRFLKFFESQDHRIVASSPVVPEGDPTLLFTNAGMNQFKDVLLGLEKRDYVRAASVQKCIRAGGKHNDLEDVGKDTYHHTFFEMLGNWSFGEYYKREAIQWAWRFVTEGLGLEESRLRVSVYKDDDDAYAIWRDEVGIPEAHLTRLGDIDVGDEENFWSMGPTGPCGPCTEIYFDHHPELPPEPWEPGFDEERFVEIWNLVFMEFNRDETGEMTPLPMQSVDTGMGLDRVAAILAGVDNVFHTDLFWPILEFTAKLLGEVSGRDELAAPEGVDPRAAMYERADFTGFCVIADHVRTVTFSLSDGAEFSNDGRGYVLRRILRRAVRYGRELGFTGPFLHRVAEQVEAGFGHVYPELRLKGEEVRTLIRTEEERFFRTLDRGIALFEEVADETAARGETVISGDAVFKLYDTFGFPPDLTEIMAEERNLKIDEHGYQRAMQEQRERSKAADDRYVETGEWIILQDGVADTFVGHDRLSAEADVLRYRVRGDDGLVELTLRETPFYAESGGQIGDRGRIRSADGTVVLHVTDTRKTTAGITHIAELIEGDLASGALRKPVTATVDDRARFLTACNHTATHLLHAALHRYVSDKAFQRGSLVAPDRLRFDFQYDQPVSDDQLRSIESQVNAWIRENHPVKVHLNVALAEAEAMGAMMIFEEKYGDRVRVVEIPGESTELCGGTHVNETNDIAFFRIVSEGGVAAGVRRIEAVTNERAFDIANEDRAMLDAVAGALKTTTADLEDRVARLIAENRDLTKQLESLTRVKAAMTAQELAAAAEDVNGITVVSAQVEASSRDELLAIADALRDRLGETGVALLAAAIDDRPALLTLATQAAFKQHKLKAGDLINDVASHVGGRGGGKPTLAQAGGKDPAGIPAAVEAFAGAVRGRLG